MSQLQHSQTGEWHRKDCAALTHQQRVECDCPEFDFYDVNPFIEAGAGEGYYFRWRGQEYVVESWATRNASGEDIYEVATGASTVPWAEEDEIDGRFNDALEAFRDQWHAAWSKHVDPAIEAAKKEVFAA